MRESYLSARRFDPPSPANDRGNTTWPGLAPPPTGTYRLFDVGPAPKSLPSSLQLDETALAPISPWYTVCLNHVVL